MMRNHEFFEGQLVATLVYCYKKSFPYVSVGGVIC